MRTLVFCLNKNELAVQLGLYIGDHPDAVCRGHEVINPDDSIQHYALIDSTMVEALTDVTQVVLSGTLTKPKGKYEKVMCARAVALGEYLLNTHKLVYGR
ncbi:hypothetical protein [Loigolactobacillus bifermentans]|uniref:Uncharacterized protein n=1 Tax=Loigolactobacillus bifermentans DSM 20003 TaxID=1423726 RepID=A0A0R1HCR5_9LACO|nr:hypothetical protein [Loigolactobacillus bifermentans]KRK40903.1 hypothetical protein FC07_GL002656 [Loigolactobacillus bifermentans DSM 20003]QGG59654.1 hypothetical protein LB003_03690 [Loigolactobacillus bifermentans]